MVGSPVWFGPRDRARFGMWHLPDGPASRAAVVLCPPLGYEAVCSHAALRDLGESLARHGVPALRVEYDGTGNSLGSDEDPDRVGSWTRSISDAVDHAFERGHEQVVLAGLRIGATMAAHVAAGDPRVRGLVLWDPAWSGRRYARTLAMLAASGGPDEGRGDGIDLAGQVFTAEALGGLRQLRVRADDLPGSVLVLSAAERPEEPPPFDVPSSWDGARVRGTAALLDTDVELSVVPREIVARVTGWVLGVVGPDRPLPVPRPPEPTTTHEDTPSGRLIHEAVRVQGDTSLFAVLTRPSDRTPTAAVVMLNNGSAPQVGPGRAWVAWARSLASEEGLLVARLDLSGLGDSPARPDAEVHDSYPVGAGRDVASLAAHLSGRGVSDVAVLGLCSGALLGYDALTATDQVRAVVSINARFDRPSTGSRRDHRWRATGRTSRLLAVPLSKTPLLPWFERLPRWVWSLLAAVHLVAPLTLPLRAVHDRGVRALLVFGEKEWGWRALHSRVRPRERRALLDERAVQVVVVPGLDHSMFTLERRATVYAAVRSFLASTLAGR